jgi:aspartoacylase
MTQIMNAVSNRKIKRALIAGGTHGNEWIGAWLVDKWQKTPSLVERPSFETSTLVANPAARASGRRYVDQDLNRSFSESGGGSDAPLEAQRAREILDEFGPRGRSPADVVFDLHTTTANMGLSLIFTNRDPFNMKLAAWVKKREPSARVYLWVDETLPRSALSTIAGLGVTVEVGPIANNVLRGDLYLGTERIVHACLDYLEAVNQGHPDVDELRSLEVFSHLETWDYPRDANDDLGGFIHPDLQDNDFEPLRPGDPIFMRRDGTVVNYDGADEVFPVFVNEAAYYEKRIAFSTTRREVIEL